MNLLEQSKLHAQGSYAIEEVYIAWRGTRTRTSGCRVVHWATSVSHLKAQN
jgi:hypothetical protein